MQPAPSRGSHARQRRGLVAGEEAEPACYRSGPLGHEPPASRGDGTAVRVSEGQRIPPRIAGSRGFRHGRKLLWEEELALATDYGRDHDCTSFPRPLTSIP